MIVAGGFGYMTLKMFASGTMDEMAAQTGDPSMLAKIEEAKAKMEATGLTMDQLMTSTLIAMGLAAVAFIGVFMMWKLRRTGYFIYVLAHVVSLLLPLLMGGKMEMSGTAIAGPVLVVAMIALFGVNLKHMR